MPSPPRPLASLLAPAAAAMGATVLLIPTLPAAPATTPAPPPPPSSLPASLVPEPAVLFREFVYDHAPFPSVHASTIATTRSGLVCSFFGGTAEGNKDVCIWVSRHDGTTWSAPVSAFDGRQLDGSRQPCWNPVLHALKDGRLVLFYKVGPRPGAWWGMVATSADDGRTWSVPTRLPDGTLGPIKNKPIDLPDGRLLCPSSTEGGDGWRVHMEFATPPATSAPATPTAPATTASRAAWAFTQTGPLCDGKTFGLIQPTLLRPPGKLVALCRSKTNHAVVSLESADDGRTWSAPAPLDLPNPNSGIDGVTLTDGRSLLVYNHTARGRSPLNVAVSADGKAWRPAVVLERDPGEYSYPGVIQTPDGRVHITYTWRREKVRHVVLDPGKL
ncbi:MAG: hypothetical protein JWO31_476 [Phycisphaerales bacterium]|nr:hypothetical protein [Phycisphaerales bacterium]